MDLSSYQKELVSVTVSITNGVLNISSSSPSSYNDRNRVKRVPRFLLEMFQDIRIFYYEEFPLSKKVRTLNRLLKQSESEFINVERQLLNHVNSIQRNNGEEEQKQNEVEEDVEIQKKEEHSFSCTNEEEEIGGIKCLKQRYLHSLKLLDTCQMELENAYTKERKPTFNEELFVKISDGERKYFIKISETLKEIHEICIQMKTGKKMIPLSSYVDTSSSSSSLTPTKYFTTLSTLYEEILQQQGHLSVLGKGSVDDDHKHGFDETLLKNLFDQFSTSFLNDLDFSQAAYRDGYVQEETDVTLPFLGTIETAMFISSLREVALVSHEGILLVLTKTRQVLGNFKLFMNEIEELSKIDLREYERQLNLQRTRQFGERLIERGIQIMSVYAQRTKQIEELERNLRGDIDFYHPNRREELFQNLMDLKTQLVMLKEESIPNCFLEMQNVCYRQPHNENDLVENKQHNEEEEEEEEPFSSSSSTGASSFLQFPDLYFRLQQILFPAGTNSTTTTSSELRLKERFHLPPRTISHHETMVVNDQFLSFKMREKLSKMNLLMNTNERFDKLVQKLNSTRKIKLIVSADGDNNNEAKVIKKLCLNDLKTRLNVFPTLDLVKDNNNPYIRCEGICIVNDFAFLQYPLSTGNSLSNWLQIRPRNIFRKIQLLSKIAYFLTEELFKKQILRIDLSLDNIWMDSIENEANPKFFDFDSCFSNSDQTKAKNIYAFAVLAIHVFKTDLNYPFIQTDAADLFELVGGEKQFSKILDEQVVEFIRHAYYSPSKVTMNELKSSFSIQKCCLFIDCDSNATTIETGFLCSREKHFCCNSCFNLFVLDLATNQKPEDTRVICPGQGCDCVFSPQFLAAKLREDTFNKLADWKSEMLEIKYQKQKDQEVQEILHSTLGSSDFLLELQVQQIVAKISNEIMVDLCPKCHVAWIQADGCCAMTCSHCNEHFCALCNKQQTSSVATHSHVRKCEYNPKEGELFVVGDDYIRAIQNRKKKLIWDYFSTLPLKIKQILVKNQMFRSMLNDLGVENAESLLEENVSIVMINSDMKQKRKFFSLPEGIRRRFQRFRRPAMFRRRILQD